MIAIDISALDQLMRIGVKQIVGRILLRHLTLDVLIGKRRVKNLRHDGEYAADLIMRPIDVDAEHIVLPVSEHCPVDQHVH